MCLIFGYMEQCPQSIQNSSSSKMHACSSLSCGMDMSSVSIIFNLSVTYEHQHQGAQVPPTGISAFWLIHLGLDRGRGRRQAVGRLPPPHLSIHSRFPVTRSDLSAPWLVAAWDLPPSGHAHHPAPAYVTYTHTFTHTCTNADFRAVISQEVYKPMKVRKDLKRLSRLFSSLCSLTHSLIHLLIPLHSFSHTITEQNCSTWYQVLRDQKHWNQDP